MSNHLHSPSEQLQVVASLSGLCLLRLLICDSGDRDRRILYAVPGLGTEMFFVSPVERKTYESDDLQ